MNESLTDLNLRSNDICDDGAAHLAKALSRLRTLTALRLAGNLRVKPKGKDAAAIAEWCKSYKKGSGKDEAYEEYCTSKAPPGTPGSMKDEDASWDVGEKKQDCSWTRVCSKVAPGEPGDPAPTLQR